MTVGSTRRRVSFLVLAFCYSRKMYVEFTLGQSMEQFLCAQQKGFLFLGGVTAEMMVDNCKTAVLDHPVGGPATLHPRYVDFAQHYGFTIKACTPRQPQQKGRVESAVAYIKGNFLNGLELHSLESLNAQARDWLNTVANVRQHAHTRRTPEELFVEEIPKLRPLHLRPYEACNYLPVRANNRARVIFETNRYSVPPAYANRSLVLKFIRTGWSFTTITTASRWPCTSDVTTVTRTGNSPSIWKPCWPSGGRAASSSSGSAS